MPTNEPSDLPVDCTVEMTQQQDVPDYRTSAPEAANEGASVQPEETAVESSDTASASAAQRGVFATRQGEYSRLFLAAMFVAIVFTFIATFLSGTLQGLIAGFSLSGLLTAFWAFLNYKICKANKMATISPMRCLAMSVFANQFGVTHAALFASAVLELIFPVLRTIRPPEIAMTFATYAGNGFAFIVVVTVAILTVWWQVILARKVYGARSRASVLKSVAMGCLFAATSIWLLVNAGAADFYTAAPIAVNCCFVFVFFLARLIIGEPVSCGVGAAVTVPSSNSVESVAGQSVLPSGDALHVAAPLGDAGFSTSNDDKVVSPRRNTLTAEWLLLLTYALTVYLSNPLTVNYGVFATLFCGVPAAVWFVYLLMETKSESRLNAAN